jgi:hypothetical protein
MLSLLRRLELLFRLLDVGKPPDEACNFIRSEQWWLGVNAWVVRNKTWLPEFVVARARNILALAMITVGNKYIMGAAASKFGMRPATPGEVAYAGRLLGQEGCSGPRDGYYVAAYSDQIKLPGRWRLFLRLLDICRALRRLPKK